MAVTAALNNAYWTSVTPNCSQLWLTQTQFAGNKAIGGGGGAIFWNGPVDDLIVSCSELEEAAGGLLCLSQNKKLLLLLLIRMLTPVQMLISLQL